MSLENLKKVLNKSPIINTYNSKDICSNPADVESYYSEIASTHMSLGDTKDIQDKIITCLLSNKTAFNGAIVGEFGFGKTSMLIYLWSHCLNNRVLAVPPYQWDQFQEHFLVLGSWYGPEGC